MTQAIKLELLREGPAHNQLLSPLTPYLSLCGNHDLQTLRVGYEHQQLLNRLRMLTSADPDDAADALQELQDEIGGMLGKLSALLAEVSAVPPGAGQLIQLRLVLSASELALLPFELMVSPAGFPGQGQSISLQTETPLVITREARRAPTTNFSWPDRPRILVIASDAGGDIPLDAHLHALALAIQPLLWSYDKEGLARYVDVLEDATLSAVRARCATEAYTHVHILAHGGPIPDTESKYGIVLHRAPGGGERSRDVVSGTRLVAALRCRTDDAGKDQLSNPTVVTLATCEGSNVGSVVAPGASLAHALHEAGIPLVIASQFPLSKRGSAIFAEIVYKRLLRGEDPRAIVHAVRQALHVECPGAPDWASLTVYAALLPDLDEHGRRARVSSAMRGVRGAVARVEAWTRVRPVVDSAARSLKKLDAAVDCLESLLPADALSLERSDALGILASAKKRQAEARWVLGQSDWRPFLADAREQYLRIFRLETSQSWALVQVIALTAALDRSGADVAAATAAESGAPGPGIVSDGAVTAFASGGGGARGGGKEDARRQAKLRKQLDAAWMIATQELESEDRQRVVWAHGSLVELCLLAYLLPDHGKHLCDDCAAMAWEQLDGLFEHAQGLDTRKLDRYSVRAQLARYAEWWWLDEPTSPIATLARALVARMAARGVPDRLSQDDVG